MIIRQADLEDKIQIVEFIKSHWKNDHIYVKDTYFFDYDFRLNDKLSFVVAIEDNEIVSILGYIDYLNDCVFLVMWKNSGKMIGGLKCLEFMLSKKNIKVSTCGCNEKTLPIYKYLGLYTGTMRHFYMLNNTIPCNGFNIAKIHQKQNTVEVKQNNCIKDLYLFHSYDDFNLKVVLGEIEVNGLKKSEVYFKKRYFEHPYYNYLVFGIRKACNIIAIIIFREIVLGDSKCLRIMDFIGEDISLIGIRGSLNNLILNNKYEYIDFYQVGISDKILIDEGFIERYNDDPNIIPNYFEPFVQENVDIHYATNSNTNFRIFKGDGDQDRPSVLRGRSE